MLGHETSERFGGRLPFMLKLLAADKALSIQVHPTIDRARTALPTRRDEVFLATRPSATTTTTITSRSCCAR